MSEFVIRAEGLTKQYRVTSLRYRHDTLRDDFVEWVKSASRIGRRSQGKYDTFWALRDVSFDVKQGEVIGLIGRNGAGKSTLLKILSRITEPTAGRAEILGRIGSLLEVGTGFDRELSGRENVFLSGAILGMRKAEIKRKFDEIIAFAEVEKFIDTPVKRYSSGMYLRLAFSVAAHLEPEILLVDEVLAVGDASFQKKCLGKMGEVARGGRTVLFVSHNMGAITSLCGKAIWLEDGFLKSFADAEDVVADYLSAGAEKFGEVVFPDDIQQAPGSEYVRLIAVRVKNKDGKTTSNYDSRFPIEVEIEYRILRIAHNLRIGLTLLAHDGTVILSSKDADGNEGETERAPGTYLNRCTIPDNFLNYGQYFISVGSDFSMIQSHFFIDRILAFRVEQMGGVGGFSPDGRRGLLRVSLPWKIQRVE
jgi:lipopolysaccharide transport system ATP-binding protein